MGKVWDDSPSTLLLLHDLYKREVADQISVVDALDTKIGIFWSIATALIALFAAVFVLKAPHFNIVEVGCLIGTSFVYFALLVQAWSGLNPREWKAGPSGDDVIAAIEAGEIDHRQFLLHSISTFQDHRNQNEQPLTDKQHALKIMLRWFVAEAAIVYVGILATAIGL